ncbi:hypothetical protein [Sphingomonas nostoxanthinifaciens]|uniref:hypothetical protein n=1 Tax=Sphingomonas nostoxanthinifaciens TaxID=2872652 RepID=UPI001CC20708|nr:hypothetical protein [Sphingomonas nostoxanthinifaciens]UAK24288.1 hypothetical protein K8P63_18515 [Sphingomonas nostoxanthinifaciens]
MADKIERPAAPTPSETLQWPDIAMVMAPAAGCDCQMLAVSLAAAMRPIHPAEVIATAAPKHKH